MKVTVSAVAAAVALSGCAGGVQHRRNGRPPASPGPDAVRLTYDVSPRVRAACVEAARATRIRVVCPPLVPADGVTSESDLSGPQVLAPDVYTLSFNNGQVPGHIHWEVGAGTLAGIATAEFDERDWDAPAPKRPAVLIGGERCGAYLIRIYRFPQSDGQLEGHDVALAIAGAITYFASIHGYNHDDADVAMLVAILGSARGSARVDHVARVGAALAGCRAVVAK